METFKKIAPIFIGLAAAIFAFVFIKKLGNQQKDTTDRNQILEKAREAKLAKSILKESQNEESTSNL
jgi:hypothetical protein